MAAGGVGGAADVGHDHGRVGRRLDEDDAGIVGVADGLVERVAVAGGDGNAGHAEGLQELVDQRRWCRRRAASCR